MAKNKNAVKPQPEPAKEAPKGVEPDAPPVATEPSGEPGNDAGEASEPSGGALEAAGESQKIDAPPKAPVLVHGGLVVSDSAAKRRQG